MIGSLLNFKEECYVNCTELNFKDKTKIMWYNEANSRTGDICTNYKMKNTSYHALNNY